jgi:hypothetical protein
LAQELNIFQIFGKIKNNLIYAETVSVLQVVSSGL